MEARLHMTTGAQHEISEDEKLPIVEVLRKDANITQQELSAALGIRDHTYRNWIKGRAIPTLTIPQMKRLCRELNCTLEELPDDFTQCWLLAEIEMQKPAMKKKGDSPLTQLLQSQNKTTADLARALQINERAIFYWLSGERIPRFTLTQVGTLCDFFECTFEELPKDFRRVDSGKS